MRIDPDRSKLQIQPEKPDYAKEIASKTEPHTLGEDVLESAANEDPGSIFLEDPAKNVREAAAESARRRNDQQTGQNVSTMSVGENESGKRVPLVEGGDIEKGDVYVDKKNVVLGMEFQLGTMKELFPEPEAVIKFGDAKAQFDLDFAAKNRVYFKEEAGAPLYYGVDFEAFTGVEFSFEGKAEYADAAASHAEVDLYAGLGFNAGVEFGFHAERGLVLGANAGVAIGMGVGVDLGINVNHFKLAEKAIEAGSGFGEWAGDVGEAAAEAVGEAAQAATDAAEAAGDEAEEAANEAADTAEEIVDAVVETAEETAESAGNTVEEGADAVADWLGF